MTSTLESSTAASIMSRLSNAIALHGVDEIPVIFNNDSQESIVGFSDLQHVGQQPSAIMLDTDISTYGIATGESLVIDSVTYKVRIPKPDGMGLTELMLELP